MRAELLPIPKTGPALFSVQGLQNVVVPAQVAGVPGVVGPFEFRWPRALFVTGVRFLAQAGTPAAQAALGLRIQDETFRDIFSDWQGQSFFVPGIAIGSGQLTRAFPLQRPVLDGDPWFMSVQNTSAAPLTLAGVFFSFDNGIRGEAQRPSFGARGTVGPGVYL